MSKSRIDRHITGLVHTAQNMPNVILLNSLRIGNIKQIHIYKKEKQIFQST